VTNAACRVYNGIHHIPFSAVADLDDGDWRRRISPKAGDRGHKFSAGYPSVEKEGSVSGRGLSGRPCRDRIVTSRDLTTRDYAVEPADHDGPLCRRCHGQALTPTSMLCPARQPTTRSAATRLVPTMLVRPLLAGTPTRARAAPSELHPAGRRCALKAPYPRHCPLLHSLERGSRDVTGTMWWRWNHPPTRPLACRPVNGLITPNLSSFKP
jgi:hypothetical protein